MKNKLWGCFLIFLISFCAVFFNYAYNDAKKTAIKDLNEKQISYARQASIGIDDFFNQWTNLLLSITQLPDIVNLDETGKKYISFIYEINKVDITAVSRVDEKGKIIFTAPFNSKAIGQDISGQKHIQEVMRSHKPVVSEVFKSIQGFAMVALHVPVIKAGKYKGTLAIGINFQNLAKRYIESIRIGRTGYARMISGDGTELYCPVPGHTGKSFFEDYKEYPAIVAMAEEMIKGKQGIATYSFDQIRERKVEQVIKHAVYMPIHIGQTLWSIVVESSENEILSSLKSFRNNLIFIIGLFFAGGAIFSFFGLRGWFIVREEQKRKQAEEALRENEQRLSHLADNLPNAMVYQLTAEPDGGRRFTYVSRAVERLNEITEAEVLADAGVLYRQVLPEYRSVVGEREQEALKNLTTMHIEVQSRLPSGRLRWFEYISIPNYQADGLLVWDGVEVDITERKLAEEKIKASLREKDILLNEIHHRVKNNMQVISGLLDLQARSSKDPELIEMLRDSQSRIRSMVMVHEKLYDSKDFSRIDLAGYMRSLSQELFISHNIHPGKIDLTFEVMEDIILDVPRAIPCGLVMNELISNVLKHAFPGDGPGKLKIIISKTKTAGIEIVVRDNGLGLPDDIDIDDPRSVGLHLVNGLVKNQLDGQIEVKRDKGTEFRITFLL